MKYILLMLMLSTQIQAEEYIITKTGTNTAKITRNITFKEAKNSLQFQLDTLKRGNAWMEQNLKEREENLKRELEKSKNRR